MNSSSSLKAAPPHYREFIARARRTVLEKGLCWEIPLDELGRPTPGSDWDLRVIKGAKDTVAARLNGFAVDADTRAKALEAGWSEAHVAPGLVLSTQVQDLIKAMAVAWCQEGRPPRLVRDLVKQLRSIFSVVSCAPWDLSSADLNRIFELAPPANLQKAIASCADVFTKNLLSNNSPLTPDKGFSSIVTMLDSLDERKGQEKLPDEASLYEFVRIIFQETPEGHLDALRFGASRLLVLSGLRIEEVRWLPLDCLRWSEHIDSSTGKQAGDVGGVTRTLRLRYFGVKRATGGADVLVEDSQQVPERFQELVAKTVGWLTTQTAALRRKLRAQERVPDAAPDSWHVDIHVVGGPRLKGSDFLFLQAVGLSDFVAADLKFDVRIGLLGLSAMYAFLGVGTAAGKRTCFDKYRRHDSPHVRRIAPHSLRHLLNGELFRFGVSDTIITKHFGRQNVAQSHEYDHRSLEEQLKDISLPIVAKRIISPDGSASVVAKLVVGGFIQNSGIAQTFLHIQREQGDDAAFIYLVANADGFHVTPYGFCVNSFAMNPCARHLKCFDNCKHYAPSGAPEHRIALELLRDRLKLMRNKAESRPGNSIGRSNQIEHASALVSGVEAALVGQPGVPLFPFGQDYSRPKKDIYS